MNLLRRRVCLSPLALLPLTAARAQPAFPSRPITIVTPYAPGGGTDVVARFVGRRMQELLGQPVIIENRAGGAGIVGTKSVITAAPDGHTLLLGTPGPNAIFASLMPNLGYDIEKDFAPVTLLLTTPLLLCAGSGAGVKDFAEFVAVGRQGRADANLGGAGSGSISHLVTELLNSAAGTKFVYVPYKGSAPAALALLSGETLFGMLAGPDVMAHVRSGKVRPLLNVGTRRDPAFPDVPTATELGLKGLDLDIWYGLLAPGGTPAAIVDKLNRVVAGILAEPATQARFAELVSTPRASTPEEFARVIRSDAAKYGQIIRVANIKAP